MSQTHPEHDHLRILIETMQRAGAAEDDIHRAVRRAAGDQRRPRRGPRMLRLVPVRRGRRTV